MEIAQEFHAKSGAGKGDESVGGGEESGVLVEEDGDRSMEGHALASADGAGGVTELHHGVCCGDRVDEVVLAGGVDLSSANAEGVVAGASVEAGDSEEFGDVGRNSIGPPTVMVDELEEADGFGLELVVGRMG